MILRLIKTAKMENKTIVIAGGTGFIGQELCNYFGSSNDIVILTRQMPDQKTNAFGENTIQQDVSKNIRYIKWDGVSLGEWKSVIDGVDLVINLTGKTVNCRYNKKNKKEILESRIQAVKVIGEAIQKVAVPPKLWINAASATIYPHATKSPRDEKFTDFANDFSVQVCKSWEKIFSEQQTPLTRKVILRMAINLGASGVMKPYFNLLKFGLGGQQGNGKQMYSWVHITDTCRMIEWIMEHDGLKGMFNCVSPGAVTNAYFMKALRKETGQRFGLPAPGWALAIGAKLIGTETELVLKSRWVIPARIQETGFSFQYPFLEGAFKEIISKTPRRRYHLF